MDLKQLDELLMTKTYSLEPITEKHAELLFTQLQTEELYTHIPQSPPKSVLDLRKKYSKWSKRKSPSEDEYWLNYAIFDTKLNLYVGTVQATIQLNGKNYIAYEVFPEFQRRRVSTEAVALLMRFIVSHFATRIFTAHVDTRNWKSYKFLESLGFKRIDYIKEADFFDGSSSDEFVYELFKAD